MNQASSASNPVSERWGYIRPGFGRTGRSLSENNFAKERRDWESILLREIIQNALDAKASITPVKVTINHQKLNENAKKYIKELIPVEHFERYKCSVPHLQLEEEISAVDACLVVEDFGTSGLTGKLDQPELDGPGENWNAFWFREGEGGKEKSSGNGGAGQGKITYFSTSRIRTIFAYTVRSTDNGEALFGASSFLRDYSYGDLKWKRDAYWGLWEGDGQEAFAVPAQGRKAIDEFSKHLSLQRKFDTPGLSLVIPSPKQFSNDQAIQIVIAEFFVPILQGNLVVEIGDTRIGSESINSLADQFLTDERARELHTCTTKGYREFLAEALKRTNGDSLIQLGTLGAGNKLSDACFGEAGLPKLREDFLDEKVISVRIPVTVKLREGATHHCQFDVHLSSPYDLDQPEQAVVRRDLLIGEEPIGSGKLRQRVRGLTLVRDAELSRLLLCAEEATHLRWNTKLPRLDEYYRGGAGTVAIVRTAMARVLEVLTEGEQKKDFKVLAKYFSAPGATSPIPSEGTKSPEGKQPVKPGVIPPPQPRLLRIEPLNDGCQVKPTNPEALTNAKLPIDVRIEFAYEGLDKDAFNEYDPLDFDLNDPIFNIEGDGYTLKKRLGNEIGFAIEAATFTGLSVKGFDKNMRLRMRLTYEEANDAATVDAE